MWTVLNILLAVVVVWMIVELTRADWRLKEKMREMRRPPRRIKVFYKGSELEK